MTSRAVITVTAARNSAYHVLTTERFDMEEIENPTETVKISGFAKYQNEKSLKYINRTKKGEIYMKKVISAILVMATMFSLAVPAFAAEQVEQPLSGIVSTVLKDTDAVRKVSVETEGVTYISEYYKESNILTVNEVRNDVLVDSLTIDLNEAVDELMVTNSVNPLSDGHQKEDGDRIDYEYTFLNYEYDERLYDDYPGDAFWFLRHPKADPEERSVYEHPIDGSEYTGQINAYVDGVDKINSAELVIGVAGVAAIGAWLIGKGIIPLAELYAGIDSILAGIGATGIGAAGYNLAQGIKDCDAAWQELFGAFD